MEHKKGKSQNIPIGYLKGGSAPGKEYRKVKVFAIPYGYNCTIWKYVNILHY